MKFQNLVAKCCKITNIICLAKFANFLIVLRVEIVTIFEPKVVATSASNTIMRKFAIFVRLYFPHITTFFNQILKIYYFLKVLSGNFVFFTGLNLVYYASGPLSRQYFQVTFEMLDGTRIPSAERTTP